MHGPSSPRVAPPVVRPGQLRATATPPCAPTGLHPERRITSTAAGIQPGLGGAEVGPIHAKASREY